MNAPKNFEIYVNGILQRKTIKQTTHFMNSVWSQFNRYAKGRGFTLAVQDGFALGNLVWTNADGERMEMRRA